MLCDIRITITITLILLFICSLIHITSVDTYNDTRVIINVRALPSFQQHTFHTYIEHIDFPIRSLSVALCFK